jgi:hypothetical protein
MRLFIHLISEQRAEVGMGLPFTTERLTSFKNYISLNLIIVALYLIWFLTNQLDTKKDIDVRFVRNQDTLIYGKTRFKTNT